MTNASNEETPLLGDGQRVDPGDASVLDDDAVCAAHRRRVIVVTFAMIILVDFAAFFSDAPQTKILEGVICNRYYGINNSTRGDGHAGISLIGDAAPDCTAGPVQAELATINQMLNTFTQLPGFFVAIPLGIAADRYGRRPVLFLTFIGALIQDFIAKAILWRPDLFTPRLIWLSSLASFVGGGSTVATAIVFLVVADVAAPQQRAQLFFTMTACERIGEIVGTPLCTLLMYNFGPWVPYILSAVLTTLGLAGNYIFMPETLQHKPVTSVPAGEEEHETVVEAETPLSNESNEQAQLTAKVPSFISKFRPLLKRNVIAVVIAFFVSSLGRQSSSFFLQYIHQRFGWSYEKASILVTLRAAVDLALLSVGLPLIHKFLNKQSASDKDLTISRLSVAFFALGSLAIALAPVVSLEALGIVIFALGSGFGPAARSLATSFCRGDETGLLYSVLGLAQAVGGLTAGPLLAVSFKWGLHLGHEWTGIPFVIVAGLFASGFIAISFVKL